MSGAASGVLGTNVLLVHPPFGPRTFWNYEDTCQLVGRRSVAPPLGLLTVAALLPPSWSARLRDLNAEALSQEDLRWADIVMTGGMITQRGEILRIIELVHDHGKPVVVGGPDVTSSPQAYGTADFLVLGEAEATLGAFLAAYGAGAKRGTFESNRMPDMVESPLPRFELAKLDRYMQVGVQFARGCPFICDFCDIIELYGRVPRCKTVNQMLTELETLYRAGFRGHVDFVDDNFIGNRSAVKQLLVALQSWQAARQYPFEFTTEASLNLADDARLLGLMAASNFFAIFVGIESARDTTLRDINKAQNVGRPLRERLRSIYREGIFVVGGFILGFDGDDEETVVETIACIEDGTIPISKPALLCALPRTALFRRLLAEGRIGPDNEAELQAAGESCVVGLNFRTARPREAILGDYSRLLRAIYSPKRYFSRVRRLGLLLKGTQRRYCPPLGGIPRDLQSLWRVAAYLGFRSRDTRWEWWKTAAHCLLRNPGQARSILLLAAMYPHLARYTSQLARELGGLEAAPASDRIVGLRAGR